MPTADDSPVLTPLPTLDVDNADLIQIFDVSTQRVRTISIAALVTALDRLGLAAG